MLISVSTPGGTLFLYLDDLDVLSTHEWSRNGKKTSYVPDIGRQLIKLLLVQML